MKKLNGKTIIYETLAIRDDVKENIRVNSMKLSNARKKLGFKFSKLATAVSLLILLTISVSAYYIATVFFAPGYGILKDTDMTIYATKEKVQLGDFIVDAVTRTVDESESTICVWLFREEEAQITDKERIEGIIPGELENITIIFDDGTEIKSQGGQMAASGFSQYIYPNTPDTNTFRLRDNNGNEAAVTLDDISKTEYANLKGIKFDDVSMVVVPLSGTGNVFAAEVTDKLTLTLSKYASRTSINASFFLESNNGDIGHASGWIMLNGNKEIGKYDTVNANSSYNMNAEKLMLNYISVSHDYWGKERIEYSFTVPNEDEKINCGITVFDAEGIKFIIKSITKQGDSLLFETETLDNVKNKHRTKAHFYFNVGRYEEVDNNEIVNEADKIKDFFVPFNHGVKNNSIEYLDNMESLSAKSYGDIVRFTPVTINSGEEIVIQLISLNYEYQWDKKSERLNPEWWKDPSQNLGVIELK